MKTTPSVPTPEDTDWNRNAGTCLSETSEGHQGAEAACDWNMVSNQQTFTDQAIDQWRDCFTACLKAKSYDVFLCVTVMTFKAYTTAVMNKLTYVSFHKVGWEQSSGKVVNFAAVSLQIYYKVSACRKLWKYYAVWQNYCKNNKVQFFCHTV